MENVENAPVDFMWTRRTVIEALPSRTTRECWSTQFTASQPRGGVTNPGTQRYHTYRVEVPSVSSAKDVVRKNAWMLYG